MSRNKRAATTIKDDRIRILGYCRVSKQEQVEKNNSIPAQINLIKDMVKENEDKYYIANEDDFYIDEGISGTTDKRPALQKLFSDIRAGKFKNNNTMIVFFKLDRFFRNIKDYYKYVNILEENNIKWKSISEKHLTTEDDIGRLIVGITLLVAELEIGNIKARIKNVFLSKVKNDKTVISGSSPYGYTHSKDKKLIIKPKEAEVIRALFSNYIKTNNLTETRRYMKEHYNFTRTYKNIKQILCNPIYIGTYIPRNEYFWNKEPEFTVEDYCDPILDVETFERVQKMLIDNQRYTTTKDGEQNVYFFSGKIFCECGNRLTGNTQTRKLADGTYRTHKYYRCRDGMIKYKCSNNKRVREDVIEKAVLDILDKELNLEVKKGTKKKKKKEEIKILKRDIKDIEKDRKKIKEKIEQNRRLWENDLLSYEDFEKSLKKFKEQLEELNQEELQEEVQEEKENNVIELKKEWKNIRELYNTFDEKSKARLFLSIIEYIQLGKDNEIKHIAFN